MDIAVLDDKSILREIRTVSPGDYKTDPAVRTVALPDEHDLRLHVDRFRYDWIHAAFMPIPLDPLLLIEDDQPGLSTLLIEIALELVDKGIISKEFRARLNDFI